MLYFVYLSLQVLLAHGANYMQILSIYKDKLDSTIYNTQARPLMDQSETLHVHALFELVSILDVNDVTQSFTCNGFLMFSWKDELLIWNSTDYGGEDEIYPMPENVWKPGVVLLNTLGNRNSFVDDTSPVFVDHDGYMTWTPGNVFSTSCLLDMTYYPFDVQTCDINFVAKTYSSHKLRFNATLSHVKKTYFTINGEWDLVNTLLTTQELEIGNRNLSSIKARFVMRRQPTFFLLNILLPVIFLSLLNIFVFAIPAESGEKIGYGITVLLALTVFMSTISSMMPRSSTSPVTIYIYSLLSLSMLTVTTSIVVVLLHHMELKEVKQRIVKNKYRSAFNKMKFLQNSVRSFALRSKMQGDQRAVQCENRASSTENTELSVPSTDGDSHRNNIQGETPKVNRYRLRAKRINAISFIIFLTVYVSMTLGFILYIAF